MKLICTALDDYVRCGSAGRTLFSVEATCNDIHCLDGILRRHVSDIDREVGILVDRTVNPGSVRSRRYTIDVDRLGALRICTGRVGFDWRGRPRDELVETLEVTACAGGDG